MGAGQPPADIPSRIRSYIIQHCIGQGGMGMVFDAVHAQIGRHCAVKILDHALGKDPQMAQRFLNEARAVSLVHHPGLVEIFDFGCLPDGRLFLMMEFLKGESLQQRLRRYQGGGLPLADAVRISRQIASALDAAHQRGVVHRDIKPANLFLTPDPESKSGERVKVLDFGVAKLQEPQSLRLTMEGAILGTPTYMSPEQSRGLLNVDSKSDVYSLGVVLFQLLCGRTPFQGTAQQLLCQHVHLPPPSLSSFDLIPPPQLEQLLRSMLSKEPSLRPTMGQVARVLEQLATDDGATLPGPLPSPALHRSSHAAEASWFGGMPAPQQTHLLPAFTAPTIKESARAAPLLLTRKPRRSSEQPTIIHAARVTAPTLISGVHAALSGPPLVESLQQPTLVSWGRPQAAPLHREFCACGLARHHHDRWLAVILGLVLLAARWLFL